MRIRGRRPRVGAVFGLLTVIRAESGRGARAVCRCSCGAEVIRDTRDLYRGKATRCRACGYISGGAARAARNGYGGIIPDRALLSAWGHRYTGMVSRCFDPNHKAYPSYGGRGISVFIGWLDDRKDFFRFAVTLHGWDQPGLDFDRIDNDGHYCPGNVRLVERKVNARNRRSNSFLEYGGERLTVSEFWERFCPDWHSINSLFHHLKQGRTPEQIVEIYRNGSGVRSAQLRAS